MGTAPACDALGLSRASLYRRRQPGAAAGRAARAAARAGAGRAPRRPGHAPHERFVDQAPAQVHATLLDEGTYLCSPRTMYRILDARARSQGAARIRSGARTTRRPSCWPRAQRSLELGHHQALGPGEVDLLLSLRDPRHLQPLRRRLDGRAARERGAGRAPDRRDLREARHSRRASSRSMPTAARRCGASPWRCSWPTSA